MKFLKINKNVNICKNFISYHNREASLLHTSVQLFKGKISLSTGEPVQFLIIQNAKKFRYFQNTSCLRMEKHKLVPYETRPNLFVFSIIWLAKPERRRECWPGTTSKLEEKCTVCFFYGNCKRLTVPPNPQYKKLASLHCKSDGGKIQTCFTKLVCNTVKIYFIICFFNNTISEIVWGSPLLAGIPRCIGWYSKYTCWRWKESLTLEVSDWFFL